MSELYKVWNWVLSFRPPKSFCVLKLILFRTKTTLKFLNYCYFNFYSSGNITILPNFFKIFNNYLNLMIKNTQNYFLVIFGYKKNFNIVMIIFTKKFSLYNRKKFKKLILFSLEIIFVLKKKKIKANERLFFHGDFYMLRSLKNTPYYYWKLNKLF